MSALRFWSRVLILCLPIPILGRYFSGKLIIPAVAASFPLAIAGIVHVLPSLRLTTARFPAWATMFVCFLGTGIVSTFLSPHADLIYWKSGIQVVGISMELTAALALVAAVRSRPIELPSLTRLLSIVMACLALVGIVQFLTNNIFGFEAIHFEWMNEIAGGFVWASPGSIGSLIRSNAFCSEPAHYGRMLGLAGGPALIRLGFVGSDLQRALRPWIPRWAAVAILLGMIMSLSPIAYFDLLATGLAIVFIFKKHFSRKLIQVILALGALTGLFVILSIAIIPELGEKMGTLTLLAMPFGGDSGSSSVLDVSALTLAANIEVAIENLQSNLLLGGGFGSHPVVYAASAPEYAILDLNSEDAAGLLIRLISETGLLGTACFISACTLVIAHARRSVSMALSMDASPTGPTACAMGLAASFVGTLLTYLSRMGVYYDPAFWTILALAAGYVSTTDNNRAPGASVTLAGTPSTSNSQVK